MKLARNRIESFLDKPDAAIGAVLLYGADSGLVRERALRLIKAIAGDPGDPFRVTRLSNTAIHDDPARLADEAAAIPFGGGNRAVWISDAAESVVPALRAYLDHPAKGALVVVEADSLAARSQLRILCEENDAAVALACYPDEGEALAGVIRVGLAAHGLTADDDAFDWLVEHLGADRRLTRAEIEKLALYMGAPGRVRLADAAVCVGDAAQLSLDDLASAVAEGDDMAAQQTLDRLFRDGASPIALLRILLRHFQRLNLLAGMVASGRSAEQAVAALRPPAFFRLAKRLPGQVARWPANKSADALELLQAAEADTKTTGLPAEAICGRAVLQLARAGRRAATRR